MHKQIAVHPDTEVMWADNSPEAEGTGSYQLAMFPAIPMNTSPITDRASRCVVQTRLNSHPVQWKTGFSTL